MKAFHLLVISALLLPAFVFAEQNYGLKFSSSLSLPFGNDALTIIATKDSGSIVPGIEFPEEIAAEFDKDAVSYCYVSRDAFDGELGAIFKQNDQISILEDAPDIMDPKLPCEQVKKNYPRIVCDQDIRVFLKARNETQKKDLQLECVKVGGTFSPDDLKKLVEVTFK